ncbi:MAG: cyclase family protein [Bacillota bacterium]
MSDWIDLTMKIDQDYLPYPGDDNLVLNWKKTFENSGYNLSEIKMSMHLGTHIDFKKHCLDKNDYPDFSRFIGKANVLKINLSNKIIKTSEIITEYNKLTDKFSTIIFNFNHGKLFNTKEYYDIPKFEPTILDFFINNNIKLIGADLPSFEYISDKKLKMHKEVFNNDIYIIENLTNLNKLKNNIYFIALPLNIANIEASIVRAIAKNL